MKLFFIVNFDYYDIKIQLKVERNKPVTPQVSKFCKAYGMNENVKAFIMEKVLRIIQKRNQKKLKFQNFVRRQKEYQENAHKLLKKK